MVETLKTLGYANLIRSFASGRFQGPPGSRACGQKNKTFHEIKNICSARRKNIVEMFFCCVGNMNKIKLCHRTQKKHWHSEASRIPCVRTEKTKQPETPRLGTEKKYCPDSQLPGLSDLRACGGRKTGNQICVPLLRKRL